MPGPKRLGHKDAYRNPETHRNLIKRCRDVAHNLVRRDVNRADTGDKNRHERKGTHFKEGGEPNGDPEL